MDMAACPIICNCNCLQALFLTVSVSCPHRCLCAPSFAIKKIRQRQKGKKSRLILSSLGLDFPFSTPILFFPFQQFTFTFSPPLINNQPTNQLHTYCRQGTTLITHSKGLNDTIMTSQHASFLATQTVANVLEAKQKDIPLIDIHVTSTVEKVFETLLSNGNEWIPWLSCLLRTTKMVLFLTDEPKRTIILLHPPTLVFFCVVVSRL